MALSKMSMEVIDAYTKGYRIVNGVIHNPKGNVLNGKIDGKGYLRISYKKFCVGVYVHRLVAFQKFGFKIFEEGMQVRHIDGNPLNNTDDNIEIGTASDNMMDKPVPIRKRMAINASNKIRKFSDREMEQIKSDYNKLKSYRKVMDKWGITSKGTLHYMLNNDYVTKKV